MPNDKRLSDMLDNLINKNPEQAQVDFHDYMQDKMKGIISPEADEAVPVQPEDVTTEQE